MSELDLFNDIFINRRDVNVNYALLTHPSHSWRTIQVPTYSDWLQVLDEFEIIDCMIDAREYNLSRLWNGGNLQEKYHNIPSGRQPITGLSFLKDLELIHHTDSVDYMNLFSRFLRLVLLSCELVSTDVRSPPVLSNIEPNTIHPGSTLAQAHQVINKPLRVILMLPKDASRIQDPINIVQVNNRIHTLAQLEDVYKGKLLGFIERIKGMITHLHLYSYHPGWGAPDQRGYVKDPDFDLVRFVHKCNEVFPDDSDIVRVTFPGMDKETQFKVTDDPALVQQMLEYGNAECFIKRY